MIVAAAIVALATGINPLALILPYFYISFGITLLAALCYLFIEIARLAPSRVDSPVRTIWSRLRERLGLLLLPLVAFPVFMIAFTTAKTGIPFLVGYGWETFWADADKLIFGRDVWSFATSLPDPAMPWMKSAYVWWGLIIYGAVAMITLYAPPKKVLIFFTATFATWFIGGCLLAYAFSASGPAFAHLFTPDMQDRFAPLHRFIAARLGDHNSITLSQQYLAAARSDLLAAKGGGISAMPSMHVGMVALLAIAAWRTPWFIPAASYWLIILIASGFTGYHYWVDGLVATGLALLVWLAATRIYRPRSMQC